MAESPGAFTTYCIRPQLYFGLITPLVEAGETLCGTRHCFVLHLIQRDAGLCQVGLSPGEAGGTGKVRR